MAARHGWVQAVPRWDDNRLPDFATVAWLVSIPAAAVTAAISRATPTRRPCGHQLDNDRAPTAAYQANTASGTAAIYAKTAGTGLANISTESLSTLTTIGLTDHRTREAGDGSWDAPVNSAVVRRRTLDDTVVSERIPFQDDASSG